MESNDVSEELFRRALAKDCNIQRRVQNAVKHLRWSVLQKKVI